MIDFKRTYCDEIARSLDSLRLVQRSNDRNATISRIEMSITTGRWMVRWKSEKASIDEPADVK